MVNGENKHEPKFRGTLHEKREKQTLVEGSGVGSWMRESHRSDPQGVPQVPEKTNPGKEAPPREWSWVETTIWTERMLAALENGVQGGKWFSLMDKVYALKTLRLAWRNVKRNQGAAGIDHISVERFEIKAEEYLQELSERLRSGSYAPIAVKRVYLPKGDGGQRPLGIPAVKDRIVQAAVKLVIEPIFEKEFLPQSYGFRPKRGAKDALREVAHLIEEGYQWVVDADLKSFFDTIGHGLIQEQLKRRISDGPLLRVIGQFLTQEIRWERETWRPDRGTPQGGVLSPLLANVALHPLDELMRQKHFKMVRYADDFVVLCRSEQQARQALFEIQTWTQQVGLELHPEKTHLGNCLEEGQGFEFLGYRFEGGKRSVRRKSIQKLKETIRKKTKRTRGDNVKRVIEDLNPTLKGWFEYFKHAHSYTFPQVDGFVRRRLRALLRKQEKRPGFGANLNDHQRWTNRFFAQLGLFTMTEARMAASQSR